MFTIINKDGGVWGVCGTIEEAKSVLQLKGDGFYILEEVKDAEIVEPDEIVEPVKKKMGRPFKK